MSTGTVSPAKHEKRCLSSGLTVHQERSDSISKVVRTRIWPYGESVTRWYQGMEVQVLDAEVIAVVMDRPMILPAQPFLPRASVFFDEFGISAKHLKQLQRAMAQLGTAVERECEAVDNFEHCNTRIDS